MKTKKNRGIRDIYSSRSKRDIEGVIKTDKKSRKCRGLEKRTVDKGGEE